MARASVRVASGFGLIMLAATASPHLGQARDVQRLVLTNRQMDSVTAGDSNLTNVDNGSAGLDVGLDLAATANGPKALTQTVGAIQVGSAEVWQVNVGPENQITPVSDSPAQVAFGGGQAAAQGTDANCAAKISLIGDFAYLNQTASAVTTPTTAICQCAALAISFALH
jgi:hypothetical protein